MKVTVFWFVFLVQLSAAMGQGGILVKGKVTDATTGEPVPFAAVGVRGTASGTSTDFEGNYQLKVAPAADSLTVTCIGYIPRSKKIDPGQATQAIDFQISPAELQLREVVVYSGENPAWKIIRKVIGNRLRNDYTRLGAYQYQSYTKVQIDVDKISDRFRQSRTVKKMTGLVEKYDAIRGEDGQTIIPIFISESVSDVYGRLNPKKKKEVIRKTKISGIGISDGSLASQLIGSSFQQYNFYNNWLNILERDFISPVSENWNLYYTYYLADSVSNGTSHDYLIEFEPRTEKDLAFTGSFWVDGETFALTSIDAAIDRRANINFIEKLKIQQSYEAAPDDSVYLPVKTRVIIDAVEVTSRSAGMLVKFYAHNRDFVLNQPLDAKFYNTDIELSEDYRDHNEAYWKDRRPEVLSPAEQLSFGVIDSLKTLPVIRTYTGLLNGLVNGYKKINPWNIDIGPNLMAYAYNNVEGHRFRLGFRTDTEFSRKWVVSAYGAYGTRDKAFKYSGEVSHIFSRKPWTMAGISYTKDVERLGLSREMLAASKFFSAFSRFGNFRRGYYQDDLTLYFKREVTKGLTHQVSLHRRSFEPLFPFAYRTQPALAADSPLKSSFNVSELEFETRLARKEMFLQNDNERISIGNGNAPVVTFRYVLGLHNFLGGDFGYHKFSLNIKQSFRTGVLGRTFYNATLGYIPSTLPYPLLYIPLGNQSLFYVDNAFNMMQYFEFASDRYASLRVEHDDNGFVFNRLPGIRKLKWRLLASGRLYYGEVSRANLSIVPQEDAEGRPLEAFGTLTGVPYLELGYGINNIFRVMRVDALHRVTYRETPGATRFAVKISFWFNI